MLRLIGLAILAAEITICAPPPTLRISAWYWLNAAPRDEWERDFRNMADLGFTHVDLCWGLDAAAWALRVDDTKFALQSCRRAGLGAYFIVWHPVHNSLQRRPEYQQVDAAGRLRFAFNTFNTRWRETQWKEYLQAVARLYAQDPAFAGYIFDDSFEIGPIGGIAGPGGAPSERFISYSEDDRRRFGRDLPKQPSDPDWAAWTQARSGWWEDWARDTNRFIREVDANTMHEVYLEDEQHVLSQQARDRAGVDFGRTARAFDAVGAYTVARWDDKPDSGQRATEQTRNVIEKTRAAVGPGKKIIYTFWVGNILELRKPGPAKYPTFEQIREICEAALQSGIRHLDMYGYRIGDFIVTDENWPKKRPPAKGPYPLTDPFPGKYLYDRPELHARLGEYLRELQRRKN
ncbi:MAG TPA: hypothetical protein VEU11_00760 [Terriglobales bacterium]|nr:hypothetical protein [Terriglobales bacterium]